MGQSLACRTQTLRKSHVRRLFASLFGVAAAVYAGRLMDGVVLADLFALRTVAWPWAKYPLDMCELRKKHDS